MQNDQRDDELLISRILFLLTYNTDLNFDELFEHHQLAESITQVRRSTNRVIGKLNDNRTLFVTQLETMLRLFILFLYYQYYRSLYPRLSNYCSI